MLMEGIMKKRNNTRRIIINLIISLLLIIIAASGSIIAFSKSFDYSFYMINENNNRSSHQTIHDIKMDITKDSSIKTLADLLYEKKFIGNKFLFKTEAKLYKLDNQLEPGTYTISSNMTNYEILKRLTSKQTLLEEVQFTIPEGFTIMQIANRLEDEQIVSKADFLNAVNNHTYQYDFLQDIPTDVTYRLEGYLFPDTYRIRKGATAEEIVILMLNRFEEITDRYTQYLYNSDYTLHDILTVASIIEREAKLEEERPIIAGVIYNRLRDSMKLQMCSTIQYALGKRKINLTYEDLAIPSPYNTYTNADLPIGPICVPGESALRAAFMPEEHDYYYFVLQDAKEDRHAFSRTADEHAANKVQYEQSQDINFLD